METSLGKEEKMGTNKERVDFQLKAPDSQQVFLAGSFNDWSTDVDPMKKNNAGIWKKSKKLPPGRYEYKFIVDGRWWLDPDCLETVSNRFGTKNNVIVVTPGNELASKRDAFVAKMKVRLDNWSREVGTLEQKAAQATGKTKAQYQKQIRSLQSMQTEYEKMLADSLQSAELAWGELKQGVESAWAALTKSLKSAKSKFK
jgi:hypothetical protein